MKRRMIHLVVAFGTAIVAFACGDDDSADDTGGGSGRGGSGSGTSGEGGRQNGGTAGVAGGGRGGGTGGAGGSPYECSSANNLSDIDGKACADESAICSVGEECCCGECAAMLSCHCDDGRWWCSYTDFCAFRESCGGAGGQGGQAGQAGEGS